MTSLLNQNEHESIVRSVPALSKNGAVGDVMRSHSKLHWRTGFLLDEMNSIKTRGTLPGGGSEGVVVGSCRRLQSTCTGGAAARVLVPVLRVLPGGIYYVDCTRIQTSSDVTDYPKQTQEKHYVLIIMLGLLNEDRI